MTSPTETTTGILAAWGEQLNAIRDLLERVADGQVEVRLYANRGKVRKHPIVVLNGGPQEMKPA
jgi:hypothetical protein